MSEEMFEIIDDLTGKVIGMAPRSKCHGDPRLVHRAAHVVVLHPDGTGIFLQKRSMKKDIQPGKWDTAVGGHLMPGENFEQAARRELGEELGIHTDERLSKILEYKVRNEKESENVEVFCLVSGGPFHIQKSELDSVEYFSFEDLKKCLNEGRTQDFTPVLCRELEMLFSKGFSIENLLKK